MMRWPDPHCMRAPVKTTPYAQGKNLSKFQKSASFSFFFPTFLSQSWAFWIKVKICLSFKKAHHVVSFFPTFLSQSWAIWKKVKICLSYIKAHHLASFFPTFFVTIMRDLKKGKNLSNLQKSASFSFFFPTFLSQSCGFWIKVNFLETLLTSLN